MKSWDATYAKGRQINNTVFPEQFLIKYFYDNRFIERYKSVPNPNILDVGAGFGRNIPLYQTLSNKIKCIDPSEAAIDFLNSNFEVDASTFTPPIIEYDLKFDLIVACNSIYYLSDDFNFDDYFRNIIALLKGDGLFIFSMLGEDHSVLEKAVRVGRQNFILQNRSLKFSDRVGQRVFVPDRLFDLSDYGLSAISVGEIRDNFDGDIRHLKVYLVEKNE